MLDKTLEHLFESRSKVRILKLFLMNPDGEFDVPTIARRTDTKTRQTSNEVYKLLRIGLVTTRIARLLIAKPEPLAKGKKKHTAHKKPKTITKRVFITNKGFLLYPELRSLVFKLTPTSNDELVGKMRRLGDIKLAVISGALTNEENSPADFVLVGDKLKRERISGFLKQLQSEVGKELNYAVMNTEEFKYRLQMHDRFIRNVLELPHKKLINRILA